ncbi:MAG: M20/M25/M40 family metallo-hydrolase, partial [Ruminococcus sp.]|nr:M20/M25/M40 family metallo-hydrolase [Ruminococcus sp.]
GCEDIAYYEKQEPFPPMVFTPDGSFPVLNCEKAMVHLTFSAPFEDREITGINSNKTINAIPDKCEVTIYDLVRPWVGRSAHGSRPENGDNAVTKFLSEYSGDNALIKLLAKLFPHGEYDGSSAGLGFEDSVSGRMTCALTCLNLDLGGRLTGGIDIRFPIDRTYAEISGIITRALESAGFEIDEISGMEPHYVPADSPFVQTLLSVYEEVKGEPGEPIAEGGITYVHNTPGGVAFGAEFPWENNNMHGVDEHISIETFKLNLNMYANAIARICE